MVLSVEAHDWLQFNLLLLPVLPPPASWRHDGSHCDPNLPANPPLAAMATTMAPTSRSPSAPPGCYSSNGIPSNSIQIWGGFLGCRHKSNYIQGVFPCLIDLHCSIPSNSIQIWGGFLGCRHKSNNYIQGEKDENLPLNKET